MKRLYFRHLKNHIGDDIIIKNKIGESVFCHIQKKWPDKSISFIIQSNKAQGVFTKESLKNSGKKIYLQTPKSKVFTNKIWNETKRMYQSELIVLRFFKIIKFEVMKGYPSRKYIVKKCYVIKFNNLKS